AAGEREADVRAQPLARQDVQRIRARPHRRRDGPRRAAHGVASRDAVVNFARGGRVKEPDEAALLIPEEAPLSERVAEKAVDHFLPNATPEARELATKALAPWAEKLVRVLDDAIRIPGTQFGIGLDAIIGMVIPGAGDFLTSIGSLSLLVLALREKV